MLTYLSLGSNLGNREDNLRRALSMLQKDVGTLVKCSSVVYTAPWGFTSTHEFANLVAAFDTSLSPMNLLEATQSIEKAMGRTEKSVNGEYHDRTIDIDILLYEGVAIQTDTLSLPHPLMYQRDFVMKPLQEIAPDIANKSDK